jgi:hypothetical protein
MSVFQNFKVLDLFFLTLRFRVLQVGLGGRGEKDEFTHVMVGLALAIQLLEKSSSRISLSLPNEALVVVNNQNLEYPMLAASKEDNVNELFLHHFGLPSDFGAR